LEPLSSGGLLVIGYGNTLRRDDGVGIKVAEAVAALNWPGISVITRHQLTPELAEPLSRAQTVVFADAVAQTPGEAELRPIQAAETSRMLAHMADPRALLALSKELYGRVPKAWSLAIPAEDFGFGDILSPHAEAGMRAALALIRNLATRPG
jgi:hydrogenase maturation protease